MVAFLRSETVWALVALSALLCVVFLDVVFGGRTLLTSPYTAGVMGAEAPYGYRGKAPGNPYILDAGASAWQYEPLTWKAGQLYRRWRVPLWNANVGFGAPLGANMQSSVFYFPAAPLLLSPTPLMWDVYLLARLLIAGIFTFLFLRSVGTGPLGSFGAAAAFMLSRYLLMWISNSWLNVDVLTPALLYGIERVLAGRGRWWALLIAAVVSATILGGMPESTFVVLLFGAGYAAFRLGMLVMQRESWNTIQMRAGLLLGLTALGIGTTSFLLLPFIEYLANAWHAHTAAASTGLWALPIRTLRPRYYSGIVVGSLAIVGVLAHRGHRSPIGWFFLGATTLSLAKSYGLGINWIGTWPVFNLVNFPKHLGVVICFSLAVLAGFGLDAIAGARVPLRRAILSMVVVTTGCLALLLGRLWMGEGEVATRYTLRSLTVAVGLIAGLVVALVPLSEKRRVSAGCCTAMLLLELLYLAPKVNRPYRYPSNTAPPAVAFVQRDLSLYRVFGLEGVLYPNTSSYFNLADIRALDALYPSRYLTYVREFINPSVHDRFTGGLSSGPVPENPTRCLRNRWFDLLGVKYVFTPPSRPLHGGCEDDRSFISKVLARTGISPALRADGFVIDGIEKPVLFQHPPSEIRFPLDPDKGNQTLFFSVGLDPRVWAPDKGDGVLFEVSVETEGRRVRAFSRWVDPKKNVRDRHWIDGSVDLRPFLHREVALVLSTKPGTTNMWDWAGWGDLRLGGGRANLRAPPQYVHAWYGTDLRVYRNTHAFPRAFVVHSVEAVANGNAALRRMKAEEFNPSRTVVVEGLPIEIAALVGNQESREMTPVDFLRYEDSRVVIRAVTPAAGILLLTDLFYPGWKAFLDGKSVPVYPADYAFRGVLVTSGEHVLEFVYRPWSFVLGLAISLGAVLLLFLFVWFLMSRPCAKKEERVRANIARGA